ncbi:MAG: hypothetical protein MK081_01860 [Flavobacteriales bacterium]|nr:hypothetical protein [Flavobacteriales bacterium]
MIRYALIACSILFLACQPKEEASTEGVVDGVARAYDKTLTWEELSAIIPDQSSEEDSIMLAERYINDWLKLQVMLHTAETNLPEEEKKFEQELENYRNTLLTYAYENTFVQQRLDTNLTEAEVNAYYEQNQEIFSLNDYIVKVKFCILAKDTPKLKRFRKLFESDESEDLVKLEQFCVDYGASYYVDVEEWMYFEDLLQQVPLEVYNVESFLKKKPSTEFEKSDKMYFVSVLDYKLKDGVSPIDLVEDQIRNLIINKRKKELLTNMREQLYKDALARNEVEKMTDNE